MQEDPGFFKNLLQELAQKDYSCLPAYTTTRSGPSHNPIFVSIVEISGESFTGQEAKTKKSSEMNAAKVAYIALRERKILYKIDHFHTWSTLIHKQSMKKSINVLLLISYYT